MEGRFCRLEPLNPAVHAGDLYEGLGTQEAEDGRWTYLPYGPFSGRAPFEQWLDDIARSGDPLFHTIVSPGGRAIGLVSYMRIDRGNGVIELGHLNFSRALQRTAAATETIYLLMHRAFDELGYRRCEWKCDSLNAPSRRAAERFGFTYEGLFRQAVVYKQRSRDTAWYAVTDAEWPDVKRAFEAWLAPENFDSGGTQRRTLSACMRT